MKLHLLLAFFAASSTPVDNPHTYLLSMGNIPLEDTQSIEAFSIETWGVEFRSVCNIPYGWRITAGNSATPNGELEGKGSQGITWFNSGSPPELREFVLVILYAPVQQSDISSDYGVIPATFKGTATISTDGGEVQRALNDKNITLTPARACPTS